MAIENPDLVLSFNKGKATKDQLLQETIYYERMVESARVIANEKKPFILIEFQEGIKITGTNSEVAEMFLQLIEALPPQIRNVLVQMIG